MDKLCSEVLAFRQPLILVSSPAGGRSVGKSPPGKRGLERGWTFSMPHDSGRRKSPAAAVSQRVKRRKSFAELVCPAKGIFRQLTMGKESQRRAAATVSNLHEQSPVPRRVLGKCQSQALAGLISQAPTLHKGSFMLGFRSMVPTRNALPRGSVADPSRPATSLALYATVGRSGSRPKEAVGKYVGLTVARRAESRGKFSTGSATIFGKKRAFLKTRGTSAETLNQKPQKKRVITVQNAIVRGGYCTVRSLGV